MNTQYTMAILLVIFALMMLAEYKNIARFLVTFWLTGTLQQIVRVAWFIILAILVFIVGLTWGFVSYYLNESVRIDADLRIEKITKKLTPKQVVVKKTPLRHARTVAYVKPIKKTRKINVGHALRSLSIGVRIAGMFPRIKV